MCHRIGCTEYRLINIITMITKIKNLDRISNKSIGKMINAIYHSNITVVNKTTDHFGVFTFADKDIINKLKQVVQQHDLYSLYKQTMQLPVDTNDIVTSSIRYRAACVRWGIIEKTNEGWSTKTVHAQLDALANYIRETDVITLMRVVNEWYDDHVVFNPQYVRRHYEGLITSGQCRILMYLGYGISDKDVHVLWRMLYKSKHLARQGASKYWTNRAYFYKADGWYTKQFIQYCFEELKELFKTTDPVEVLFSAYTKKMWIPKNTPQKINKLFKFILNTETDSLVRILYAKKYETINTPVNVPTTSLQARVLELEHKVVILTDLVHKLLEQHPIDKDLDEHDPLIDALFGSPNLEGNGVYHKGKQEAGLDALLQKVAEENISK